MQLTINGQARVLEVDGSTLSALVAALDLTGKRIAIEHNGAIVPRSRYADTSVRDGDRVEIVGAVGGG